MCSSRSLSPRSYDDLKRIASAHEQAQARSQLVLMVGFNRRFAPHVQQIHELLVGVTVPKTFVMTVNAGAIPAEHWTQDLEVGGGRIVGEGCHFVDLLRFLAGAPIVGQAVYPNGHGHERHRRRVSPLRRRLDRHDPLLRQRQQVVPEGAAGSLRGGRVLQLDNFRRLRGFGWPGFKSMNLWRQDKGQKGCALAFVDAVKSGGVAPISFSELLEVARVTIEIEEAARA